MRNTCILHGLAIPIWGIRRGEQARALSFNSRRVLPNHSVAMRRKYFVCARNSACEVAAAIDLAVEIEGIDGAEILRLAYELTCLTQGLMR